MFKPIENVKIYPTVRRAGLFEMILTRMNDPRSLRSWFIKGTNKSTLVTDSLVPVMPYNFNDLGSLILIQITSKERTLRTGNSLEGVLPEKLGGCG